MILPSRPPGCRCAALTCHGRITLSQIYVGDRANCASHVVQSLQTVAPDDRDSAYLLLADADQNDSVIANPDDHWGELKGVSLEKVVDVITTPDFPLCSYFFNIFPTFWNPISLFRLLVDVFNTTPLVQTSFSRDLPPQHMHIFSLLRNWIKHSFKTMTPVQKDLKIFFIQLVKFGGAYKEIVEKIMDGTVDAGVCVIVAPIVALTLARLSRHSGSCTQPLATRMPSTSASTRSAHGTAWRIVTAMLQEAKLAVRNGTLPVRMELAVILTATQIHIEELQRARAFSTTLKPLPNVKVKNYFPEGLKVGHAAAPRNTCHSVRS